MILRLKVYKKYSVMIKKKSETPPEGEYYIEL